MLKWPGFLFLFNFRTHFRTVCENETKFCFCCIKCTARLHVARTVCLSTDFSISNFSCVASAEVDARSVATNYLRSAAEPRSNIDDRHINVSLLLIGFWVRGVF